MNVWEQAEVFGAGMQCVRGRAEGMRAERYQEGQDADGVGHEKNFGVGWGTFLWRVLCRGVT